MPAAQSLSHEQWAARLKRAHAARTRTSRGIRLPGRERIHFSGCDRLLKIHLGGNIPGRGVLGNMQDDGSAFEAWALAFRFWCGVEGVEIGWDVPAPDPRHPHGDPHYNRFLYRVERFCEMFPALAGVAEDKRAALSACPTRTAARLELNSSSRPRVRAKADPESMLEKLLADGVIPLPPSLPRLKLHRQLPVGLFLNAVGRANAVFTARASAVDLWAVEGDTAWLLELKAAGNRRMGMVSELVFYANLIRDAISPQRPAFAFSAPSALAACRRVRACFLVQEPENEAPLHPLLGAADGGGVLDLLDGAAQLAGIPVRYEVAVLGGETRRAVREAMATAAAGILPG